MNFDPLLSGRFSRQAYEKILIGMSSADVGTVVEALSTLSDTLVYSSIEVLGDFPIIEICQNITTCLKSDNEAIRENAALCMFQVLEAHPASTRSLICAGALEQMKTMLLDFRSITTIEHLLRAADVISMFHPIELAQVVGIEPILNYFDFFTVIVQRVIMKTVAQLAQVGFAKDMSASLAKILPKLTSNDERIANYALDACVVLGSRVGMGNFPLESIPAICASLNKATDGKKSTRILNFLARVVNDPKVGEKVIQSKIDFERLLFDKGPKMPRGADMANSVMNLIVNLLPAVDNVNADVVFARGPPPPNAAEFAKEIQPLLMKALMEKQGSGSPLMEAFVATLTLQPVSEWPPSFLMMLGSITMQKHLAPYVLLVAERVPPNELVNSGLLQLLTGVNRYQRQWFKDRLKALKAKIGTGSRAAISKKLTSFSDVNALLQFVHNENIASLDLSTKGVLDNILRLIQGPITVPQDVVETLKDRLLDLLVFLPLKSDKEYASPPCEVWKDALVSVSVSGVVGAPLNFKFDVIDSVAALEGLYNEFYRGLQEDLLIESRRRAGRIGEIVQLPRDIGEATGGEIGWLHRIFNTEGWQRLSVTANEKPVSAKDMIYRISEALAPRMRMGRISVNFEVTPATENDERRELTVLPVPTTEIEERMLKVLNILKALRVRFPNMKMRNDIFAKSVLRSIGSPAAVLSGSSAAIQIACHYPFLFAFSARCLIVKLMCGGILPALDVLHKVKTRQVLYDSRNLLKCVIKRDQLFEDGVLLLKKVGVSQFRMEVSYEGEEGIGVGPTAEFYASFAKELCKKSHGLWRNSALDDSEYVFDKMGLFPAVNADPELFFVLGILCAKAIESEYIVPLPFSRAFFKLVKGIPVQLQEVDPELDSSLKSSEGLIGLPFLYPGTEIEMKENGSQIEVTAENFKEYQDLVIDYTCGSKIQPVIDAFRVGFGNVLQRCFCFMSADELISLISGDECENVTLQDLQENVELSNGYTIDSPQIQMLFEVIVEMPVKQRQLFFKFITGSERLPLGGLSKLLPKLTIAKKVGCGDDALPSAMTCTNYFKLPPYDTKEELVQKLILAIEEGQGSFSLT